MPMPVLHAMFESVLHGDTFRDPVTLAATTLAVIQWLLIRRLAINGLRFPRPLYVMQWCLAASSLALWLWPHPGHHAWAIPAVLAGTAAAALHVLPRYAVEQNAGDVDAAHVTPVGPRS